MKPSRAASAVVAAEVASLKRLGEATRAACALPCMVARAKALRQAYLAEATPEQRKQLLAIFAEQKLAV